MNMIVRRLILVLFLLPILSSCTGIPKGVTPVSNFDVEQYLGKWYEIARLDHKFERGLEGITAEYSLLDNGTVKVLNSGYSLKRQEMTMAEGKAKFVEDTTTGHLKVSFFGPFYGSYVVFNLGDEYEYAFVTGPDTSYLWLLARSPDLDQSVIDEFISEAGSLGFPTDELIFVDHSAQPAS